MVEVPDLGENSSVVGAAQVRRSTRLASKGAHNLGKGVSGIVGRHNPNPRGHLLLWMGTFVGDVTHEASMSKVGYIF